jgi:hypothetical protein
MNHPQLSPKEVVSSAMPDALSEVVLSTLRVSMLAYPGASVLQLS